MKILSSLSLACFLSVWAFGASEVYYIRANGEFGKQLSEMAKQYAKDNNQNVEVFIDEDPRRYKDSRVVKAGVDRKGRYSISLGAELYAKQCKSCHGENAEKRVGGIKPLKDQTAQDIEDAIISYRVNSEFGGTMRGVMQNIAKTTSNNDLGAIIAYLKGKDAYAGEIGQENKPVSTEKKQGSYLR